jgi:hypothetical protein
LSGQPIWITHGDAAREGASNGGEVLFTIATLVNDARQYDEMLRSFSAGGFTEGCEYLALDNRAGNRFEPYGGARLALGRSKGRYLLLCHQDLRLIKDGPSELLSRLEELDKTDPLWALAGNSGGTAKGLAIRISDPHGEDQRTGSFPARAWSLDENFIVIKRSAMVAPSADLSGFHLYGLDLCLQAQMRGHAAYVIDFHLRHLGAGTIGGDYYDCLEALEDKYARVLQTRRIQTTCLAPTITASAWRLALARLARLRKKLKKLRIERLARARPRQS